MTPEEFLRQIRSQPPAPAYLFLGPEAWQRSRCRKALVEKVLPPEDRADGYTHADASEVELAAIVDDARSLSLFASNRVIWVGSAEAALPRTRGASDGDESEGSKEGSAALAAYLRDPSPGVVMVFECSRFDFDGEDKARLQRVQKFYSSVPAQVEFARMGVAAARRLADQLAKEANLSIGADELDLLVDVLGAEAARIAMEIDKLSLYAGARRITREDIVELVPNARASNIFALVAAIGRGDRIASLNSLDILVREGEYLPLALTFLATQFRLALVAKEEGLRNAGQIQAHFTKQGTAMWRARAEQVADTVNAFPLDKLREAILQIAATDKALRDTRPDDRTVMENFVLGLTGKTKRAG